jgi:hypothetical protein
MVAIGIMLGVLVLFVVVPLLFTLGSSEKMSDEDMKQLTREWDERTLRRNLERANGSKR